MKLLKACIRDEQGQDLVEYTLLLAFIVLASAALLLHNRQALETIWTVTNNNLAVAATYGSH